MHARAYVVRGRDSTDAQRAHLYERVQGLHRPHVQHQRPNHGRLRLRTQTSKVILSSAHLSWLPMHACLEPKVSPARTAWAATSGGPCLSSYVLRMKPKPEDRRNNDLTMVGGGQVMLLVVQGNVRGAVG